MPFPRRETAIVGVYVTEQGKLPHRTGMSLQLEAVKGALDDAGLTAEDVDGIITNVNQINPMGMVPHMTWGEQFNNRPLSLMDIGQTSGGLAKAAAAIHAGLCNVVVYVWGQSGFRIGPGGTPATSTAPRTQEWSHTIWGAYMTAWYAIWAQRYMHEFGATSEELAEASVVMRYHATLNPDSIMGSRGPISTADVVQSRMIASPLHLLDCAIDNDGGYAVVITSAERAKSLKRKPVYVLGGAESTYIDPYINIDVPWFPEDGKSVRKATDMAFAMAGVSRDDIDVAGLYDCFSITVLRDLEEMGFCKIGEAADYIKGGRIQLGGALPVNPHGGLLSCSHNGSPHGMHTIEVVKQLRGECGKRQVNNAKIGVSLAQGSAVHGHASTLIMATE
ncbi:thiolase family protein [Dehalococcoidia bacterium]|nr:thiolase family protein [Dehalococcoidia bacterium]